MRVWAGIALGLCLSSGWAAAKPLLDSSEESYASVCMAYDDAPERLVEICQIALQSSGYTDEELAELEESLGIALYELDRLDEAMAIHDQTLARDPVEPRALRGKGWVEYERENFAAAAGYFQKSLDISASAYALAGLGSSLWEQGEIEIDDLVTQLEAAVTIKPTYGWAERQIGWRLLEVGRNKAARDHFAAIIEKRPWDENARAGLIKSYKALGDHENIILQVNQALSEDVDRPFFIQQRTEALFRLGRYHQTIRDADLLIEEDPEETAGYVWRARAMSKLGRGSDAMAFLAASETTLGEHNYIIYWRAWLMLNHSQYAQVATQIRRNIEAEHIDTYDLELLGWIEYNREDFAAARQATDRSLAMDADNESAMLLDAMLLLSEGEDVQKAIDRFDTAMQYDLYDGGIGDFAVVLVEAGYLLHAIAIRAKYPD